MEENNSITLTPSIIWAVVIFVLDAFILNQGGLAVITILVVILFFLPSAIYNHYKRRDYKKRYLKCLLYIFMSIAVFTSNYINNQIAHNRAEELIKIIEQYKQDTGYYPERLDTLIPKYLIKIPTSKFSMWNRFFYYSSLSGTYLFYMDLPPFGRPIYDFDKKEWKYLD